MLPFEIGKTYLGRFISDFDNVIKRTVISRTYKTITCDDGKTFRVINWNGCEQFKPLGSYSMSPVISAAKED